jgi:hypothetical protein
MAAEAEKTRLDRRAPVVRVSVEAPDWPPIRPRQFTDPTPGDSTPYVPEVSLSEGQIYRMPKNTNDRIALWAEGQATNEGSLSVDVELRGLRVQIERQPGESGSLDDPRSGYEVGGLGAPGQVFEMRDLRVQELHIHAAPPGAPAAVKGSFPWSELGTFRRPLQAGQTLWFRLEGEWPVSAWIANHRAYQHALQADVKRASNPVRPPTAVISGQVLADDSFDNGIKDMWPITLTGLPLEPVPEEDGAWQIPKVVPGRMPISATVGLRQRTYWRSKERGLQLPTPEV